MTRVQLYDTTRRDGMQMEGMSLSVEDKLQVAQKLDELGVQFIEGGFPGSNVRDAEFFVRARHLNLKNAQLVAFGGTRRAGLHVESDPNIRSLLDAQTPAVTFVGKSSAFQVREIIETSPEENLAMIRDSIRYMKEQSKTVFFDAEHFFDGFLEDADYSLQCLKSALNAGADGVVLCDTNGGMMTSDLLRAIKRVKEAIGDAPFGIHVHDDAGLGVANTLAAVDAGASQVQACINGYGERCGNANMITVIANLKLKLGIDVVSDDQLSRLTEISHFVSELANLNPNAQAPFVGISAFAHKAGYHVAGIVKNERAYQHVDPALVGNTKRVLVSDLSGQRNIIAKMQEQGVDIPLSSEETRHLVEKVKLMESRGYQYDGAEASFELLVRRSQPEYRAPFELEDFMIVERRRHTKNGDTHSDMMGEAVVKLRVGDSVMHTAGEGNGPVNALDAAVRKALLEFYPSLAAVKLSDYKVRILDGAGGTSASVRVLIESTDGVNIWRTVGSSTDVIEASWLALADSLEYWLHKHGEGVM
ncbi:MAG: citramalate synthase [Dehalococcoidia bacterium]